MVLKGKEELPNKSIMLDVMTFSRCWINCILHSRGSPLSWQRLPNHPWCGIVHERSHAPTSRSLVTVHMAEGWMLFTSFHKSEFGYLSHGRGLNALHKLPQVGVWLVATFHKAKGWMPFTNCLRQRLIYGAGQTLRKLFVIGMNVPRLKFKRNVFPQISQISRYQLDDYTWSWFIKYWMCPHMTRD